MNTVEVIQLQEVVVKEQSVNVIELLVPNSVETISIATQGPQGPPGTPGAPGPQGPPGAPGSTLSALGDVDITNKVDQSVLYFSTAQNKWLGDDVETIVKLTDGGNF